MPVGYGEARKGGDIKWTKKTLIINQKHQIQISLVLNARILKQKKRVWVNVLDMK